MEAVLKAKVIAQQTSLRLLVAAVAFTAVSFAALGTVAAIWENPLFIRMTPVGGWELGLLGLLSLFAGLYVVVRRPFCSNKTMGAGGVLGFVGIACPVCNKILLLAFGSELLLTYFEPIRVYVAAFGVFVVAWAVLHEWRQWEAPA